MKFNYDEDYGRDFLVDWEIGDRFYYLNDYPAGDFSIIYVEAINRKKNGKENSPHVSAMVLETLFATPSAIKHNLKEGFQLGGVWPISFYKTISDCTRDGIRKIFTAKQL